MLFIVLRERVDEVAVPRLLSLFFYHSLNDCEPLGALGSAKNEGLFVRVTFQSEFDHLSVLFSGEILKIEEVQVEHDGGSGSFLIFVNRKNAIFVFTVDQLVLF